MPLWWSIEKVADYKSITGHPDGDDRPTWADSGEPIPTRDEALTKALVFATMSVGLDSITEKNWTEFLSRMRECEKAGFWFWYSEGKGVPFPADAIERRIGLATNAGRFSRGEMRDRLANWKRQRAA